MSNSEYTHIHKESGRKTRIICDNFVQNDMRGDDSETYIVLQYCPHMQREYIFCFSGRDFYKQHKKMQPWDNCKVDDPVYARAYGVKTWVKRHFAGLDDAGSPMFWSDGRTSFNYTDTTTAEICYPANQAPEDVVKCAVF